MCYKNATPIFYSLYGYMGKGQRPAFKRYETKYNLAKMSLVCARLRL
ncbi:MAG: hypothetical protein JWR72_2394 [Flavisolibacter sp.]|jgi:hypothetical protein|nr:hypothetical protein [Flavisolibacter sp.]